MTRLRSPLPYPALALMLLLTGCGSGAETTTRPPPQTEPPLLRGIDMDGPWFSGLQVEADVFWPVPDDGQWSQWRAWYFLQWKGSFPLSAEVSVPAPATLTIVRCQPQFYPDCYDDPAHFSATQTSPQSVHLAGSSGYDFVSALGMTFWVDPAAPLTISWVRRGDAVMWPGRDEHGVIVRQYAMASPVTLTPVAP